MTADLVDALLHGLHAQPHDEVVLVRHLLRARRHRSPRAALTAKHTKAGGEGCGGGSENKGVQTCFDKTATVALMDDCCQGFKAYSGWEGLGLQTF